MNKEIQAYNEKLRQAVADIKEAILQGQYEACKGVNRIQLAVYFGIGKYISQHTRKGVWGTGALETISEQLRRELPGLRGYSATQMREMRLFYEAWTMLDANSSVATDELETTASALAKTELNNSSVVTDELQVAGNHIDIHQVIQIPNITEFPIEDFFKVPFTHHTHIIASEKTLDARYYYIHRTAEEHLSVDDLKKLIKNDAYGHREYVEFMIRDYSKPMGVATYKTADDMPEKIRKALPDIDALKKLMSEGQDK